MYLPGEKTLVDVNEVPDLVNRTAEETGKSTTAAALSRAQIPAYVAVTSVETAILTNAVTISPSEVVRRLLEE